MSGKKIYFLWQPSEVFLFEVESRFTLNQVSGVSYGLEEKKEEEIKLIIHPLIPPLWCNCSLSLIVIQEFISMQSDKSLTQSEPVSTSRCWLKAPIQKYNPFFQSMFFNISAFLLTRNNKMISKRVLGCLITVLEQLCPLLATVCIYLHLNKKKQ